MDNFVGIIKALADASRLRIFRLVIERELCVCQIIETMRLAPSTISKHLLLLKQAGLVTSRKCGRWIYYRLASDMRGSIIADTVELVKKGLKNDGQTAEDLQTLKKVMRIDREELCRKMAKR